MKREVIDLVPTQIKAIIMIAATTIIHKCAKMTNIYIILFACICMNSLDQH